MILQLKEIQPEDRKHLHCTDRRFANELAAVNRSLERLGEGIATWTYIDPERATSNKEVTA